MPCLHDSTFLVKFPVERENQTYRKSSKVLPIPIEWAVVKRSLEILGIDLGLHFPSFEPFYPGDFHALKYFLEKNKK